MRYTELLQGHSPGSPGDQNCTFFYAFPGLRNIASPVTPGAKSRMLGAGGSRVKICFPFSPILLTSPVCARTHSHAHTCAHKHTSVHTVTYPRHIPPAQKVLSPGKACFWTSKPVPRSWARDECLVFSHESLWVTGEVSFPRHP